MAEVAVALSGGVDSSVAAALLAEAGREVVGVTMRLGQAELAGHAAHDDPVVLARRVCETLGIEHVVVDLADAFVAEVVTPYRDQYAQGRTPNPCVTCNERVKFGLLAEHVRNLGASTLATGHYARLVRDGEAVWLARAVDTAKDQSYFLYRVPPTTLATLEFPLGGYTKAKVRAMAADRGLPTAEMRESREACFTDDHAALVGAAHPEALVPGPIVDERGAVLGVHRGIARYTVGQRKGLGIGGPDGPYVVVRIDAERDAVVVAHESAARMREAHLTDAVWRGPDAPTRVLAQVRYRARPLPALATPAGTGLTVVFDDPTGPLAPGQSLVCYVEDRVIGGGVVGEPGGRS